MAAMTTAVSFARRAVVQFGIAALTGSLSLVRAQSADGVVRGRVIDPAGAGISGASIHLSGTTLGGFTDAFGVYVVRRVPAASYTAVVRRAGFAPDSFAVEVHGHDTVTHEVTLRRSAQELERVVVTASPRLNETIEQALSKQRSADNIVSVLSGDVIRALPNANAAEAAARIPGVSTERDEGEGKFVQIRGTEPRLSNVTVNGVHIPGTQSGSRVTKLDDVPTDILGAIEVTKTLTADQDADAIGGSVNLVTKV